MTGSMNTLYQLSSEQQKNYLMLGSIHREAVHTHTHVKIYKILF